MPLFAVLALFLFSPPVFAGPLKAELVLIYAIESNIPIYVHDPGPPYIQSGVRIELNKDLGAGFFLDLNPYVWSAEQDRLGGGGAIVRLGWLGETFGVQFVHESRHNFDRASSIRHDEWDAVELRWRLN